jgi:hypothetical protein
MNLRISPDFIGLRSAHSRTGVNITLASLHLVAQTLDVRIADLFRGVETKKKPGGGY